MEHQNNLPPLKYISTSGVYRLKLTAPKLDKIKDWGDGTCSVRLFFVDDAGNCLRTKGYGTKYPGSLATLVGRISGTFAKEIAPNASPADLQVYLKPAVGIPTDISVEVTPDGEWEGRPQYKYKLTFPRGSRPAPAPAPDLPTDNPPF